MPGPIGYTVRFIKHQLDKRRAGQPADGVTPPEEPGSDKGSAPSFHARPADGAAGGGSPVGCPDVTDEEFGAKGSREAAGVPRDPAHARSKRLSYLAIVVMGFGLAIDYSMSLMSIQPLFYTVNGPEHAYGLCFGSYDLTALLMAPLFGAWTDRTRQFRPQARMLWATDCVILAGAAANAVGNLIYAFTMLADGWLVAGVGAATLGIGSSYITQTTTAARRQVALGRYRITQNIARMCGPFVGFLFLGLPEVHNNSSTGLKLFNWYTIPGWFAFALVVVLSLFFWYSFEDPTKENEHLVKPEARDSDAGPPTPERVARFRRFAVSWLVLSFFSVFAAAGFTSNLFALFAGQYHGVESQTDNWKTYIGVGCGAAAAGILFRRLIRWCPQWFEERRIALLSNWLLFVVWMLVIPWGGETWVPPQALFYAATGLMGFLLPLNQAAIETVFSKKLRQGAAAACPEYGDVVGDHVGKWMGAYFMAASAGRFAGPLVVAGVTRIATPDGQSSYCTEWSVAPDGAPACVGPWDQQCMITGNQYWVGGCVLLHAIPMYSTMAALQFCVNLGFAWVLARNWSWGEAAS